MNSTNTLSISELRQHTAQAIKTVVSSQQPTIILQRSQPKAVLIDYEYYQALEEAVIDNLDAKVAEKAKKEPRITLESYIQNRWKTKRA